MGTTGEQLAAAFERANDELIEALSRIDDEAWKRSCSGEGWSVGVTAHHIVGSRDAVMGVVRQLAEAPERVEFSADMLNDINAAHAREFAAVGRDETLALARSSGEQVAAEVRSMADDRLAAGGEMSGFGRRMSAADMVQGALIGHTRGHLESIREALKS